MASTKGFTAQFNLTDKDFVVSSFTSTNISFIEAGVADWNLIYNDEANIDHFEIMYKNGEAGKISEVGRTTGWSSYVGNIVFEGDADQPYIGVRAASVDLKTYSPVQWVKVERSTSPNLPAFKDNTYCESVIDPASAGIEIARTSRYLTNVKTTGAEQDLDFTASKTSSSPSGSNELLLSKSMYAFPKHHFKPSSLLRLVNALKNKDIF